jgi:N-methylhydantoinase B
VPGTLRRYLFTDLLLGGFAAASTKDGAEGICSVFNSRNIPIEVAEVETPVLVERFGFVQDSSGAGRWRGASAVEKEIRFLGESNRATPLGERHLFAPHGLLGGREGAKAEVVLLDEEGNDAERLHSKAVTWFPTHAVVRFRTSGAGGYGSPLQRPAESVRSDVLDEFISASTARDVYGVALADDGTVDEAGTARLRSAS